MRDLSKISIVFVQVDKTSRRPRKPRWMPQGWPDRLLRLRHRNRRGSNQGQRVPRSPNDKDHLLLRRQPRRLGSGFGPPRCLQTRISKVPQEIHTIRHRQDKD